MDKAAEFFKARQNEDGCIGDPRAGAGITSICVLALVESPLREKYRRTIEKGIGYLMKFLRNDGSVSDEQGNVVYKTSVLLSILSRYDYEKYKKEIEAMKDYLLNAQYWNPMAKEDVRNGGWGYDKEAKKERCDMSNTTFAAGALRDARLEKGHEAFRRMDAFVTRSLNNPEANQAKIKTADGKPFKPTNDGGGIYGPGMTRSSVKVENPDGTVSYPSYGSMTYAALLSMIYAFVDRDDSRVKGVWGWIRRNWTLDENPGISAKKYAGSHLQGLYYYYMTLAKALYHYGKKEIKDERGGAHNWAAELIEKLVGMQGADGTWKNENKRWYENQPALATAYAVMALSYAHRALSEK